VPVPPTLLKPNSSLLAEKTASVAVALEERALPINVLSPLRPSMIVSI
jgi:hypothetical protein